MRNDYESNQSSLDLSADSLSNLQHCASDPNPSVCLIQGLAGLEVKETNSRYTSNESNLTLTQVIYDPEVSSERATGRALAVKAIAEMAMAEKSLILRVLEAYLEVLRASDDKWLAEQQLQSIADQQKITQRRFELGVGKETEVYDAQAAYDVQSMAYEATRTRHYVAVYKLSQMTGVAISEIQPLSENILVEMPEPYDMQSWVQQALEHNDGIKVAEATERVAHYEVQKHKLNRLPRVMAAANYNERELKGGQGFQPASSSTAFGIDVRLPLYHGGALYNAKKQAAYQEIEAQDTLSMQRERVETAVVSSLLLIKNEVERYYRSEERRVGKECRT